MAKCTTARDFFANQGGLTLPYFVYGKENQRKVAEKDPPFGRFDIFQTRPRLPVSFFLRRMLDHTGNAAVQQFAEVIQGIPDNAAFFRSASDFRC